LPFLARPSHLDGSSLPCDCGFDPLGLATSGPHPSAWSSVRDVRRMGRAEVRHGRAAMLACWGYPVGTAGYAVLTEYLLPPATVCSGNGCAADFSPELAERALSLAQIALVAKCYWSVLFLGAALLEIRHLRATAVEGPAGTGPDFSAGDGRLAVAEMKHGRLAMVSLAIIWVQKVGPAFLQPSGKGMITFGHQLWGETCVVTLAKGEALSACYPQNVQSFDFVLSWEIMFRVLTGYNAEPYF